MSERLAEARRQLDICNACRYCEGYCAVYPALERRRELSDGDLVQLANLCHDCRACYYACMYAPPHEFAINVPLALSSVRRESYRELSAPLGSGAGRLSGRRQSAAAVFGLVALLVVVISAVTLGLGALWRVPARRSPYGVVPYGALLALALASAAVAVVVFGYGARRYWRRTGGGSVLAGGLAPLARAVSAAATLRNLSGGGEACTYPDATPNPARRVLHGGMVAGFTACLGATVAAGIEQDLLGREPPYAWISVPVLLGTLGGALLVLGSLGLGALKARADPAPGDEAMAVADFALLAALFALGVTGLATFALRDTRLDALVLVVHLAAVFTCFLLAPFTKFAHGLYRMLALLRDQQEQATASG